jgi:hypothetical protein
MPDQAPSLAAALVQLQGALPRITKDDEAQAGTRRYAYANLSTITEAVFPILGEFSLYWTCLPTMVGEHFLLHYRLGHAPTGEELSGFYPLTSSTPQTMGGQITYARRYALCAVLGIAPAEDDDDAQAAEADQKQHRGEAGSGLMSEREQAHHRLLAADTTRQPKKAERVSAGDPQLADDPWAGPVAENAEDKPGSITADQLRQLGIAFGKIGIGDRQDRLAACMSMLDLPGLESSKDLSYRQAEDLKGQLAGLATEEKKEGKPADAQSQPAR